MQNIDNMIKIINGVGFPIVMCLVLVWMHNNTIEAQQRILDEFENTLQNNTIVLNKLVEKLNSKGD